MGLLDFVFRQAPGAIAGIKRGQRERQELQRKQGFEDQDRARRDAMDQANTQRLLEEYAQRQADAPLVRREREARIGELEAQAAQRLRPPPAPRDAVAEALEIHQGKLAADKAAGAGDFRPRVGGGGGIDQGLKFNETARLRGEFQGHEKSYNFARVARNQMLELAKDNTGSSDINLLIAAAKVADPESVVREGEVAIQRTAASLADRVGVKWANLLKGDLLSPEQRTRLVATVESRMAPLRQEYERRRGEYEGMTKGFGGDPGQVVGNDPEPFTGVKGGAASSAAAGTPQNRADQWEALVKGGMSPADATAQLERRRKP